MSARKPNPVPSRLKGRAASAAGILLEAGQDHVLAGFDSMPARERAELESQLAGFDQEALRLSLEARPAPRAPLAPERIEPLQSVSEKTVSKQEWDEAVRTGSEMLASGRVAAFTAAGGHGTRLGFDGPKGAFPIGPVSDRSLFRIFAESIAASSRRHGAAMPWIVMTGRDNHDATAAFLDRNSYFGLDPGLVSLVMQGALPVLDAGRRIVMESRSKILTAPDGHGGFFRAMETSGAFERLQRRGVGTIFYFQVDNPLLRIPDEAFIGFHARRGSLFSTKVVEKISPEEKMGVVCRTGGVVRIVEYSEIGMELSALKDSGGRLVMWAGNAASHVIDLDFAREIAGRVLPFHAARKQGSLSPDSPFDVVKMESFIFDALAWDPSPLVFEAARSEEFAPVKSADGRDTPAAARRMLTEKYASWIEAAGVAVERGWDGTPLRPIEISPLTASSPEDLLALDRSRISAAVGPGGPGLL